MKYIALVDPALLLPNAMSIYLKEFLFRFDVYKRENSPPCEVRYKKQPRNHR